MRNKDYLRPPASKTFFVGQVTALMEGGGTTTDKYSAARIETENSRDSIAAGNRRNFALKWDGSSRAWGKTLID